MGFSINNLTIESVVNFLGFLFENGASYSTLNIARSALSTKYGNINGVRIGEHHLVSRLMKGAGRLRPPKPKYKMTWDPQLVLTYLKSLGSNVNMPLRDLSKKLTALLALCSGQRVQTLGNIKVSEINTNSQGVRINVEARLKTSKPGMCTTLEFTNFSDSDLCVVSCLKEYLDKTKEKRSTEYLLIQTKHPYERSCTQTISNWLREVLKDAGIDNTMFSAHSYRHASTSKAHSLGVPMDTIFKAAGWSKNSETFCRFYKRPFTTMSSYSNALLSNKNN